MHKSFLLLLFVFTLCYAQPPRLELDARGFAPVEVQIPTTVNEKLIEVTKAWAGEYNNRKSTSSNRKGYDVTDVTDNSMTVHAYKRNAFFYRERGQAFNHSIDYTLKFNFYETYYTVEFAVENIYIDNDKLIESDIPDYFTSAGRLKEGYDELETSLEANANEIVLSHYNFLISFR